MLYDLVGQVKSINVFIKSQLVLLIIFGITRVILYIVLVKLPAPRHYCYLVLANHALVRDEVAGAVDC